MSSRQRGLGRGFDALIPISTIDQEFDPTAADSTGKAIEAIAQLDPSAIEPNPHQPRQDFDQNMLEGLADSIRQHGILQPLVVTKLEGAKYQLIAGERRLRAAKMLKLNSVPAIVRSFNEQQKLELALIENLQRQDLNPMETATAFQKLLDQFNLTYDDIAQKVGKDRTTVINTVRLLGLPIEAKRAIAEGKISEGHGRQILAVPDRSKQLELLKLIIENRWTVAKTEAFARDFKAAASTRERAMASMASSNDLTQDLENRLKTKVWLRPTAKGGRLIIEYSSEAELNRIYRRIKD